MQEKQQDRRCNTGDKADEKNKDDWAEDQTKRSYYYDDAHGYEVFDPGEPPEETKDEDHAAS